jgi:hypothetical protein
VEGHLHEDHNEDDCDSDNGSTPMKIQSTISVTNSKRSKISAIIPGKKRSRGKKIVPK